MWELGADYREFDNDFLASFMDYVSPNISDGSILQEVNSGRDGSGGVTFVPCTDVNGFNYDLAIGKSFSAQATRTVQMNVEQTAAQDTLGGRLLTFLDAPEDVFGSTVQVAVNIMPDGVLKAFRANAQGTGFILRNTDQAGDSQMTLLGTSPGTVDSDDYLEVTVVHHPTTGSITVWKNNVELWALENVNTAISGENQSTDVYWGGYGVTGDGDDVLHHEDLAAIISDVIVINGSTNADDPNDPTQRIGDHKPQMSLPTADGNYTQFTPDPVGNHFANVDEIPPDSGTTENSAAEVDLRDNFAMSNPSGEGSNQVYLAYTGFVRADTPAECGVSDTPANFEAFVYTEQTDPGEVHTGTNDTSPCNLTDFISRRSQSVCTISQNGEKVTFKVSDVGPPIDAYYVGLSPLNAPPRLQTPQAPGYLAAAGFQPKIRTTTGFDLADNINVVALPGSVSYNLPFSQPWKGLAADTADEMDLAGDFFQFQLSELGTGLDVGVVDNAVIGAPFNPYTSELIAFHFREDIEGSPYYWIGPSFGYGGETIVPIVGNPVFKIVRNDPNIELFEDVTLKETFTPGAMPTTINPFVFLGRWGFTSPFGYIRRPGITNAIVQIGSNDCCPAVYVYDMLATSWDLFKPQEMQQWGIEFTADFSEGLVMDPGSTHGPFPLFGYTADTRVEFSLEGGNIVLRIYDYDYLDGITDVGGVGTYTYTIPYADTDDFTLQSVIPVGPPDFPNDTLEFAFTNQPTNAPLRLVTVFGGNNGGDVRGIEDVSFTFIAGPANATFAGFMRQSSVDRSGTVSEAPTGDYAYEQSFLASTPSNTPITLGDTVSPTTHGYIDPEV